MSTIDSAVSGVGPSGLGGWLILPIIGLVLSPFVGVVNVLQTLPLLQDMSHLTGFQVAFVFIEMAFNIVLQFIGPIFLLIQLFGKRQSFPRLYVTLIATCLAWVIIDLAAAYIIFIDVYSSGAVAFWDRETVRTVMQSIIAAVIWIPYMSNSLRVKNTFIN